jgi:hypothetical protein
MFDLLVENLSSTNTMRGNRIGFRYFGIINLNFILPDDALFRHVQVIVIDVRQAPGSARHLASGAADVSPLDHARGRCRFATGKLLPICPDGAGSTGPDLA